MADETKKIIVDISLNDNDYAKAAANAKKATEDLKKQINDLSKAEGDNSTEIAKLTAQMKNQQAEYNNNIKALQNYEKGVKNANNSYDSLLAQWKLADVELKKLEGTLQLNEDGTISMSQAYLDAQENVKNAKDAINNFGKGVSDGRMSVGLYSEAIEESTLTLGGMRKKVAELKASMENLDPNTEAFESARDEAAALELQIGQVTGKLDEFGDKEPKNPAKKQFEDLTEAVGAATVAT